MAKDILNETVQVESDDDLNDKGSLGSYTTTPTPVVSDGVLPRSVWSIPRATSKPLHDVQEPETWSFNGFAAYVEALVNSTAPPSRPKSAAQPPKTAPHIDPVAEKLMALYKNPESVRWASSRATVLTLQYLTMKGKVPLVRLLLEIIEVQSKNHVYLRLALANPSVYNVLLDSASQALDLHTYNFLLRMMTDRGVTPTIETWTSLLHLVQKLEPSVAKHIVNTMRTQGMLAAHAARAAAASVTLPKSAEKWLNRDESIFDFIAHNDKLWDGKEWLEPFGCNQLLTLLVSRGNVQDTLPLVKELQNRNKRPNLVTAHILINAAASYRDLSFAMDALEATIGKTKGLQPDRRTFDKLFYLAFRLRAYNTLRVVWRYACLSGNVSQDRRFKMSAALRASLRGIIEKQQSLHVGIGADDRSSRHQHFKIMAPTIAVGITEVIKDVEALKRMSATQAGEVTMPSSSDTTISTGAAESTETAASTDVNAAPDTTPCTDTTMPADDTTSADAESSLSITSPPKSTSYLHSILASDLLAHETFVPTESFLIALRAAVDKDLLWKQQGYEKTASLETLLTEAVTVGVRRSPDVPSGSPTRRVEVKQPQGTFTEDLTRKDMVNNPQLQFQEDKIRRVEVKKPQGTSTGDPVRERVPKSRPLAFQDEKIRRIESDSLAMQEAITRKLELELRSSQDFTFRPFKLDLQRSQVPFQEDKIRRVETDIDEFHEATARKLEQQQEKWSKEEFEFRVLKLETEEEKQAHRARAELEKQRAAERKRLAEQKRLEIKKSFQEREKRLQEKKRLEAKKKLEKKLRVEAKKLLEAKLKLEQNIKKLQEQQVQALDKKLQIEAQKWLEAVAKIEENKRLEEEKKRVEEEQLLASLQSLAYQIPSSDVSNEEYALGEEEGRLLAKEQALEAWKEAQEKEKLEDLGERMQLEAQKWLEAKAKLEASRKLLEEKKRLEWEKYKRLEEEQKLLAIRKLATQVRRHDDEALDELEGLGKEERRLVAKEQARLTAQEKEVKEKRWAEEEAAAEGEWKRLHEEMREMLGKK